MICIRYRASRAAVSRVRLLRATILAACALAAACGQKGPLYVPGVPPDAAWPYPVPAKPAPSTAKKVPDVPARSDPATAAP